jgi:hypothetical protein
VGSFAGLSGGDFYFRQEISCDVLRHPVGSGWNLADPGVVGSLSVGQGQVTVLQLDPGHLPSGPGSSPLLAKLIRIYCTVLTNAGVRLEEPFQLCPEVIDLSGSWSFHTDPGQIGEGQGWATPAFSDRDWRPLAVPGPWEFQPDAAGTFPGIKNFPYQGLLWYRRPVDLPPLWQSHPVMLHVGGLSSGGKLFLNGTSVTETPPGENFFAESADVPLPADLCHWNAPNLISFKITDTGMGGGITGPLYLYTNRDWLYRSIPVHYGIHYPNYDPESYHYW